MSSLTKGQAKVHSNEFLSQQIWFGVGNSLPALINASIPLTKLSTFQNFTNDQIYSVLTNEWLLFTVPLVVIFTKFDGQVISEYSGLPDTTATEDRWEYARKNAESVFCSVYLPRILDANHPPKVYVRLEGENSESASGWR